MVGTGNFTDEFKRAAVAQVMERDYRAKEVSKRFGVGTHALHAWTRKFAKALSRETDAGIRRLKRPLARLQDHDILKKPTA